MSTLTKEEIDKLTDSLQYGNDVAQENARRWAESLFKQRAAEAGNSLGDENRRAHGRDAGLSVGTSRGAVGGRGVVGSDEKYTEKVWIKMSALHS